MKWAAIGMTVLVSLVSLAGQPAFPQTFDEMAIRPGEGIGPVRLGMTLEQAAAVLGRAPDGESTDGSLKVYRWNLQGGGHNGLTAVPALSLSVAAGGSAEAVSTTSTAFTTPGGSAVGLSLTSFKEEFGAAYRGYKDGTGRRHLRFDTAGIAVTYDIRGPGQTTVHALTVFKPAAAMPGPAPMILAGVGVGPVRLGMSADDVVRAMGRGPQGRGNRVLVWVLEDKDPFGDRAWLSVFFDNRGVVDFIVTDAVVHATPQGNTPGTSMLDLQAEFGVAFRSQPFVIPGETSFMGIWYDQYGIIGLYHPADPNKRIQLIAVYKRG